eukprot:633808-Pyramimonas_sp.AAC.1
MDPIEMSAATLRMTAGLFEVLNAAHASRDRRAIGRRGYVMTAAGIRRCDRKSSPREPRRRRDGTRTRRSDRVTKSGVPSGGVVPPPAPCGAPPAADWLPLAPRHASDWLPPPASGPPPAGAICPPPPHQRPHCMLGLTPQFHPSSHTD